MPEAFQKLGTLHLSLEWPPPSLHSLCSFLGRNLQVCKSGQQCERKPEANAEAAPAPEGYGMSSSLPPRRPTGERPVEAAGQPGLQGTSIFQSAGLPCLISFVLSSPGNSLGKIFLCPFDPVGNELQELQIMFSGTVCSISEGRSAAGASAPPTPAFRCWGQHGLEASALPAFLSFWYKMAKERDCLPAGGLGLCTQRSFHFFPNFIDISQLSLLIPGTNQTFTVFQYSKEYPTSLLKIER